MILLLFVLLTPVQTISSRFTFTLNAELDMCGKTIVLDQEHGKEQVEERLYLSVVVMIIKSQQIQM